MAILIFRLRGVSEDEAKDVRAVLSSHGIAFYETSAGSWGISMPAIWLRDESDWAEARQLIDAYQDERRRRLQAEHASLEREGKLESTFDRIKRDPLRFLLYLAAALAVLYLSTKPFLDLGP
jgi:hypothetical protein